MLYSIHVLSNDSRAGEKERESSIDNLQRVILLNLTWSYSKCSCNGRFMHCLFAIALNVLPFVGT